MTITGLPPAPLVTGTGGLFASSAADLSVDLSIAQTATDVTVTPSSGSGVTIPAATTALAGMLDAVRAAAIDALPGSYNDLTNLPDRTALLSMIFDGGGSVITPTITRYLYIPFAATITGYALLADVSGSVTIDVWKEPFSGFPPTVANSITGGNPMAIASAQSNVQTIIPSSWTVTVNVGDCLAFNLSACASIKALTASLFIIH